MSNDTRLPEWVLTAEGRREPFDPDRISQSLFAALAELGQADAFVARELADAVLHFLAREHVEALPSADLADLVGKVVRELDHPELSRAYLQRLRATPLPRARPPAPDLQAALRDLALASVFGADLASAHREGWLTLGGLEAPAQLAACVVDGPFRADGWLRTWSAFGHAAACAQPALVLDSPEWDADVDLAALIATAREATGRTLAVNLNAETPPAWAQPGRGGPLFPAPAGDAATRDDHRRRLLAALPPDVRVDWHLHAAAFAEADLLRQACARALAGGAIAFTFDRPRRPIPLGEGLDRKHPAVLLEVRLNLGAFARHIGQNAEGFLRKLPSLARMAVSAGVQKRRFLRRLGDPPVARGFLLDRARLLVTPAGLDEVTQEFTGQPPGASDEPLAYAREIVRILHDAVQEAARSTHLDAVLDIAEGAHQLHLASQLHAITGSGTASLSRQGIIQVDDLLELLREARKTDVSRIELTA